MLKSQPSSKGVSFEEQRASFEKLTSLLPLPPDDRLESATADGVAVEWRTHPGASESSVLYYLHGGGYVTGSISTHRELVSRLSRAAGARSLSVGYRLAPENPFPAAVEDAVTGYRWLLRSGVNPAGIVVAGDSAGGGLAVATLVALRDAGDPLPAAAVCLSPWVDLEGSGDSMTSRVAIDPIIDPEGVMEMAKAYLGASDARTPLASPLYADLRGLPPLLIQAGTAEVLLDDSIRLAQRARLAGVGVSLDVWEDMIHVWQIFAVMLPEGREAITRIGDFVRAHVA
jgi:acetyl esterase/lipase